MNSLQEAMERRHAELGGSRNPFYSASLKEPVTALVVEASDGKMWGLPWNHFISGCQQEEGGRERLVLTFVSTEITIIGLNLDALSPEIAYQRLEKVRAAPGKYLKYSENEPFIENIQVHSFD
jgi:hypothetical protein